MFEEFVEEVKECEKQLILAKEKLNGSVRLWSLIKHLSDGDIEILGYLIKNYQDCMQYNDHVDIPGARVELHNEYEELKADLEAKANAGVL